MRSYTRIEITPRLSVPLWLDRAGGVFAVLALAFALFVLLFV